MTGVVGIDPVTLSPQVTNNGCNRLFKKILVTWPTLVRVIVCVTNTTIGCQTNQAFFIGWLSFQSQVAGWVLVSY